MRDLLDYPLGAVRSAFNSVFGWTAAMFITGIAGLYAGMCIESRDFLPLSVIQPAISYGLLFAVIRPDILVAFLVTFVLWFTGMTRESFRFQVVAAIANTALWAAVAAWEAYHWVW